VQLCHHREVVQNRLNGRADNKAIMGGDKMEGTAHKDDTYNIPIKQQLA
jgi:hypothetical protein